MLWPSVHWATVPIIDPGGLVPCTAERLGRSNAFRISFPFRLHNDRQKWRAGLRDAGRSILFRHRVRFPDGSDRELATFTGLIPGIEPDLSSYPHKVPGVWAFEGEAGAFWRQSPSVPPVNFGPVAERLCAPTRERQDAGSTPVLVSVDWTLIAD